MTGDPNCRVCRRGYADPTEYTCTGRPGCLREAIEPTPRDIEMVRRGIEAARVSCVPEKGEAWTRDALDAARLIERRLRALDPASIARGDK